MKHRMIRHKTACSFLILFFLLSDIFLTGCGQIREPQTKTGFYFNTVISITVYRAEDAGYLEDCFSLCETYEKLFSRTLEGSDIYRNNHSQGEPVTVSGETVYLLEQACYYARLSGGRIDPTVALLDDLWNFSGQAGNEDAQETEASSGGSVLQPKKIPADADIQSVLPHITYENIHIETNTVSLADPLSQIDLGFIAKGYIADKVKELLLEKGVKSALINLGGNVLALGNKPDGSAFTIGMQKPFDEQGKAIATLSLSDHSLVSSGVYERYFRQGGRLYHHILDTKTGYPVENGLLGVTILSGSSMEGDALSTTCFVLGLTEGMELIEAIPDTEAVFITEDYQLHPSSGLSGKLSEGTS